MNLGLPAKKSSEKTKGRKGEIAVWAPDEYAREIDRVISDFERRFEHSLRSPFGGSWIVPRWRPFELPETRHAFADLIDSGNEYRVRAEVPGIPKEKLNISVTPRDIKIEGEAETNIDEKKEGFVHRERTYSKVKRNLVFPEEVVAEKADATVKDGILEVVIPKKTPTESKVHKIQVR